MNTSREMCEQAVASCQLSLSNSDGTESPANELHLDNSLANQSFQAVLSQENDLNYLS